MASAPDNPERLDVGYQSERKIAAASVVQGLKETVLLAVLGLAGCLGLALASYSPQDPGPFFTGEGAKAINAVGIAGAWAAQALFHLLGVVAYAAPLALLALVVMIYRFWQGNFPWLPTGWRVLGVVLILLAVATLCGLHFRNDMLPLDLGTAMVGGIIGAHLAGLTLNAMGVVGGTVLLLVATMVGLSIGTGLSWLMVAEYLGEAALLMIQYLYRVARNVGIATYRMCRWTGHKIWFCAVVVGRAAFMLTAVLLLLPARGALLLPRLLIKLARMPWLSPEAPDSLPVEDRLRAGEIMLGETLRRVLAINILPTRRPEPEPTPEIHSEPELETLPEPEPEELAELEVEPEETPTIEDVETETAEEIEVEPESAAPPAPFPAAAPPPAAALAPHAPKPAPKKFQLPSVKLLTEAVYENSSSDVDERLERLSELLEHRLADFGVDAKVTGLYPGPVVTRFEIQPAAGVKAAKISGLARDLARSLAVLSVRVVEVIPGKTVVGVEIPNEDREVVQLSETLSSAVYKKSKSNITLALGKDIAGEVMCVDLAPMPHLLVAGTTGSGKSVGINSMLLSILFKATPRQVRLIMVDPKMLELSVYEGIPHLLTPVITDMKQAANALSWCVYEMDRRYRLMSGVGVRNLQGFNEKVEEAKAAGEPLPAPDWFGDDDAAELDTLPLIVVVIDEFAEMMMMSGKKTEELIVRIAQKARAAGIHLILATQRPSVDVITGLIKANIPGRLSFKVATKIDSRTILDQGGAEQLLGHGDMLYIPSGTSVPIRVHGAFVDDAEVHRVAEEWRRQAEPDYLDAVLHGQPAAPGEVSGAADEEQDELYAEAVEFVTTSRRASISSLQRKLRVGYNRAARLIDTMEEAGIVSQMDGAGNREVLVGEGQ